MKFSHLILLGMISLTNKMIKTPKKVQIRNIRMLAQNWTKLDKYPDNTSMLKMRITCNQFLMNTPKKAQINKESHQARKSSQKTRLNKLPWTSS